MFGSNEGRNFCFKTGPLTDRKSTGPPSPSVEGRMSSIAAEESWDEMVAIQETPRRLWAVGIRDLVLSAALSLLLPATKKHGNNGSGAAF